MSTLIKLIKLSINGRAVEVSAGTTLLQAAAQAGVHLPTLCHHPRLPSHAVCRLCLVSVKGNSRPQPACTTPASEGDVVDTDTPTLQAFRRADLQWLLERHPNACMRCELSGACQLQRLVSEYQLQDDWRPPPCETAPPPPQRLSDHTSPSIWRDLSKCVECGLCADACGAPGQQQYVIGIAGRGDGRRPVTLFDRPLAETRCISCGQCTLVCPTGALLETPHWHAVLRTLDSRRRISVVQVAPATRIAISEEFGMAPGVVSTGRMINALRQLGFDYVFDTNFGADLTVMEESTELLARLETQSHLPLMTSCCPGWVNWVELNRPDLLPHLSSAKSPQQMHGALSKRGPFARALGPAFASGQEEPYVVSVMPCTAKKDEAARPGLRGDVDHVVTTRELARMIRARNIAFGALADDGVFDSPLGASTGAAQLFAASGGVMEAVIRTASHLLGQDDFPAQACQALRGVEPGLRTARIPGIGQVAICNGIAAAQELFRTEAWRELVAIEVMACVGGCLGGGGEPKSLDPHILEKRMHAVYELDRQAPRRRAHENPEVQQLYADDLASPCSAAAHALLHTSYAARHSARLLLMRFLDCVDRRDADGAANLLHPQAEWLTDSAYGDILGAENISQLIAAGLPARHYGNKFARHRMASSADCADLTVIAPNGERCRFELEIGSASESAPSSQLIRKLTRKVLPPQKQ